MYKIAVCEDDSNYSEYLKKTIIAANVLDEKNINFSCFLSGEELLFSTQLHFDLVIMDIQLNGMNGFETAMKLRKLDNHFVLVFCSGPVTPFYESYKANPYRFLKKGISDENMIAEMKEILTEVKKRKQMPNIFCKSSSKEVIKVYPESILYISRFRNFSEVHITGELAEHYEETVLRSGMKLNEIHQILDEECGFARIHNSYLVNMFYITSLDPLGLQLANGERLTCSRARVKEFQCLFAQYAAAKY